MNNCHLLQGGYNGYGNYRPGYGGQNYQGSGMNNSGAYRGGRGAGDGGQMQNPNNPLWAAQGYPVTGPGGSVFCIQCSCCCPDHTTVVAVHTCNALLV